MGFTERNKDPIRRSDKSPEEEDGYQRWQGSFTNCLCVFFHLDFFRKIFCTSGEMLIGERYFLCIQKFIKAEIDFNIHNVDRKNDTS